MITQTLSYKEVFNLETNTVYQFPDFALEYMGEFSHEPPESLNIKKVSTFKIFRVTNDGLSQELKWSAGTGMLFPLNFEVASNDFHIPNPWEEQISVVEGQSSY